MLGWNSPGYFSDSPEIVFCDSVTINLKVLQKK